MSKTIELEKGQLTWTPKTVLFEGKEYPAPLNLLPILTYRTIIEFLTERTKTKYNGTNNRKNN
jgi:hypothetical protein